MTKIAGLLFHVAGAPKRFAQRENVVFRKSIYGVLCFFTVFSAFIFVPKISAVSAEETATAQPGISIENISAVDGKITANITVRNTTGIPLNNVMLFWTLEESSRVLGNAFVPGSTLAIGRSPLQDGRLYFSLRSGESVFASLSGQYPKGSTAADGRLSVMLMDIGATVAGATTQSVALHGNGEVLSFDSALCALHIGASAFPSAPVLFPNETPAVLCQLSNLSNQTITATPVLRIGVGALYRSDELIREEKGNAVTLAPFETRVVDMEFPSAPSTPQQYEAALALLDKDENPVSPIKIFSWAVQGPSATIIRATFDKDGYRKDETANVTVVFSQSADIPLAKNATDAQRTDDPLRWIGTPFREPHVALTIRDGGGRLCGTKDSSLLPLNSQMLQETLAVMMSRNCVDPSAEIIVSEQDNTLAAKTYHTVSSTETAKKLQKNMFWYFFGGLIILAAIALAIVLQRNRRYPHLPAVSSETTA